MHAEHVAKQKEQTSAAERRAARAPSAVARTLQAPSATLERRRAADALHRSLRARPARDDAGPLHLGRPLSEFTAKYRYRLRELEQSIRGF